MRMWNDLHINVQVKVNGEMPTETISICLNLILSSIKHIRKILQLEK